MSDDYGFNIWQGAHDDATDALTAIRNKGWATTGATGDPENGMLYYDSTDNKMYCYVNGSWVDIGQSGGASPFDSYSDPVWTMTDTADKLATGGETDPDCAAGGITFNLNEETAPVITAKSTGSVSHPFTFSNSFDADTYFTLYKQHPTNGGARLQGYSETDVSFAAQGYSGSPSTSDSSGVFKFTGYQSNGGDSIATLDADDTLYTLQNLNDNCIVVKGDGDTTVLGEVWSKKGGTAYELTAHHDFNNTLTAETTANDADTMLIYDASATAYRKMTRANFLDGVGGGGTPAGSDTQVQYNNGGAFGAANMYWDDANDRLGIGSGASSPSRDLHIYHDIDGRMGALLANTTNGSSAIATTMYSTGAGYLEIGKSAASNSTYAGNSFFYNSNTSYGFVFKNGATEAFRIAGNGTITSNSNTYDLTADTDFHNRLSLEATANDLDEILIADQSASFGYRRMTRANFLDGVGGGASPFDTYSDPVWTMTDTADKLATGGETSPDCDAGGITLNLNSDTDFKNFLTCKSVVNSMYNRELTGGDYGLEADTRFLIRTPANQYDGIEFLAGSSSGGDVVYNMLAVSGNPSVTTSNSTYGVFSFQASEADSSSTFSQLEVNDNIATFGAKVEGGATQFIIKGDGDAYCNGTHQTYDEEDDLALVRAAEYHMSGGANRDELSWTQETINVHAPRLEELGIWKNGFISWKGTTALMLGGITKLNAKLEARVEQLTNVIGTLCDRLEIDKKEILSLT